MSEFTDEEIEKINEDESEKTARDFEEFKEAVKLGRCSQCGESLTSFKEEVPCLHWLLLPDGFRKKHFKKLFETFTYDRIEAFLRWYVNVETPLRHINDLREEHDGDKVKALTIQCDNLEWSFSIAQGCLEGKDGKHGPHYHFQMRVDGRPLHNYSDRHIKLSDYELWMLNIEQGKDPQFKRRDSYGMGMQGAVDDVDTERLLSVMRRAENEESATFHVGTLLEADAGHMISGDDIADLLEESRCTGVPMHQLIKRLEHVKAEVYIEPGPGVPAAAQRTPVRPGRRKRD